MALGRRFINYSFKHVPFQILSSHLELPTFESLLVSIRKKHYNPKFKWHRKMKVIMPNLDFEHKTEEERRAFLKSKGLKPPRFWSERPIYIASSQEIFDPYLPPQGDGKVSFLSKQMGKQLKDSVSSSGKNMLHLRKIKKCEPNFNLKEFTSEAHEIYINAHSALASNDLDKLSEYATEKALHFMLNNTKGKTLRWKFIESLEPPSAVHVRVGELLTDKNYFAQVTVRFHTKQMLAIYDRFGRLMYGSEILAKDVLEFAVFEKHIVNVYGRWKLHDKIIPDWVPPPESIPITHRKSLAKKEDEEEYDLPYEFAKDLEVEEDVTTAEVVKQ